MNRTDEAHAPSRLRAFVRSTRLRFLLISVALGATVAACEQGPEPVLKDPEGLARTVLVPSPMVELDLPDLAETGTLRVLLRNSSSSYFILRGEEWGFEYELAREFARAHDLKLQVVLPDSHHSAISLLNRGSVDLVAAPILPADAPVADVHYSAPYNTIQQVIVVRREHLQRFRAPMDLERQRVAVRHWSSEERALLRLRQRGLALGIVMLPPDSSTEEILEMIADGTYPAALAHDNVVEAVLRHRPERAVAFPLGPRRTVHWAVRSNAPQLNQALDAFLGQQFDLREGGSARRTEFYAVIHDRYFGDERQIQARVQDPFLLSQTGRLSPYDPLFRRASLETGLDWRLLASLAFQESRFDPEARSWANARGLMQILPETAGVDEKRLLDPELNVELGARHLRRLYNLGSLSYLDEPTRLAFALAAYNCGEGHLRDARVLALRIGLDANAWEDAVADCLLLLSKSAYHSQPGIEFGYVRGTETVSYVNEILRRYERWNKLTREKRPITTAYATTSFGRGASD
jgi:membrane-bound lytic murein transglycosylase F